MPKTPFLAEIAAFKVLVELYRKVVYYIFPGEIFFVVLVIETIKQQNINHIKILNIMKTIIKTSAIVAVLALLSTGVFAKENPTKKAPTAAKKDVVLFTALSQDKGVGVIIHKADVSKTAVSIYDADGNLVMKDVQAKSGNDVLKGYVLSALDNGKYTIKVSSNNNVTSRVVRVYNDENDQKAFLFEI